MVTGEWREGAESGWGRSQGVAVEGRGGVRVWRFRVGMGWTEATEGWVREGEREREDSNVKTE